MRISIIINREMKFDWTSDGFKISHIGRDFVTVNLYHTYNLRLGVHFNYKFLAIKSYQINGMVLLFI